jgi:hypothetical protein
MNQQEDFVAMAKAIIDSTLYMVLGTADESGQPWVSPVYFMASKYKEFYSQTLPGRVCGISRWRKYAHLVFIACIAP